MELEWQYVYAFVTDGKRLLRFLKYCACTHVSSMSVLRVSRERLILELNWSMASFQTSNALMVFMQFPIPLVRDTDPGPQVSHLLNEEIKLGRSYSVLFFK